MNTPDFAKIVSDTWPLIIGALIGSAFGHFVLRRPPDIERIRKQLGRALSRFADIPSSRLEPAILAAAESAQRGWGSVRAILVNAFWLGAALVAAEVYRAFFPELPRWHSIVVCGVFGGLLAWVMQGIERRAILHRIKCLTK
jgi:hypothetical protein